MAKILRKGQRGAARAYVTRSAAVKKLQCSLADFRRLCILKGIFPREPRHRKRANKGNSVSTSFYYAKDIAYLAHEPVLGKLREHKAFAKKLSRALGRGEWSSAKSLEDGRPIYRLDHIVKERYPSFTDALRDIDDALCLITLFASLPSGPRLPAAIIESCARLSAEWQLYVMHTQSLRKVFLSIKGIYYQAEVSGQTITWLAPYLFTQTIPTDVDIRVMLTFLELYQTLLGFVFFKLYADAELVYPPPMDKLKDDGASGVGAYKLEGPPDARQNAVNTVDVDGKPIKKRDVRKTIKEISAVVLPEQPPFQKPVDPSPIMDDNTIMTPYSSSATLFGQFTIYLAPGSSRPILEFIVRSFGGRLGWPSSMGSGSPIEEDDPSITHVITDRPTSSTVQSQSLRLKRKYVQPQWIVDSINAGKVLAEGMYAQGETLPPHLSPFGEEYSPASQNTARDVDDDEMSFVDEDLTNDTALESTKSAIASAALTPRDSTALRKAELTAERAGLSTVEFETKFDKAVRVVKKTGHTTALSDPAEAEMNKMLMSNKHRKLLERIRYGERKRAAEEVALDTKRSMLRKEKTRKAD